MNRIKPRIKSFLSVSLAALLITCILANILVVPAYADDDGFALRFDGTTDFVQLPPTATVFAAGWESTKSVALWIKPDGTQTNCTIVADPNAVAYCPSIFGDRPTWWGITIGYLSGQDLNRIWVWNYDGVIPTPGDYIGIEYTAGVWTHIALVHSGGVLRAFKNGVEVGSVASSPTIGAATNPVLSFGGMIQSASNAQLFKGDIDELSLWNRALTGAEITANMYQDAPTDPTGLAAFYRMTDGSGTTLTDNSGNGRTGTLSDGRLNLPGNGTYPLWVDSGAFDVGGFTVTINQASGQADPTAVSPINFTVVFSEVVTDFTTGDVTLSGTAGATTATVTGSGTTYNVAVSGMAGAGDVTASLAAGVAHNAANNPNPASSSIDNTVTYQTDTTGPTVTINQADTQADPTDASPINFTVVFSEAVTDFVTGDVTLSGTAGATTATVTGSGTTYNVAVSGMTGDGTVTASIAAGAAHDAASNPSSASTSTDNTVTYQTDLTGPAVTINQADTQADPTDASPINFTVVFSEAVTDFATGDVTLSGTAGATLATVTGSGTTYNVAVSGMTVAGTVTTSIAAGAAHDAANNPNSASTSTDDTVTYELDTTGPSVTIEQADGQPDPTNATPIHFTVTFSESVADFTTGDVTLSGTAGATTATVTGSGTTYDVEVSGMTGAGDVTASIAAGVAHDAANNPNLASTSVDNSVTYDPAAMTVTVEQAITQPDPTNTTPINFTVVFSEAVTDFDANDVTLSGTAVATTAAVTGSGTTYNVEVSGMASDGTVIVTIAAGVAHSSGGNPNVGSTSSDNTITYDTTAPTVTIEKANGQSDPAIFSPVSFTVVFSESVSGLDSLDVTLSGTSGATTATVAGSGTTYTVEVSGMTLSGTVIASIAAGAAQDAAGNTSSSSTSLDNSVLFIYSTQQIYLPVVTR